MLNDFFAKTRGLLRGVSAVSITAETASIVVTGLAPEVVVASEISAEPAPDVIVVTGFRPTVVTSVGSFTPDPAVIEITGLVPDLSLGYVGTPASDSLVINQLIPSVSAGVISGPTPGSLEVTGLVPVVDLGAGATPTAGVGSIEVTGLVPTVTTGSGVALTPYDMTWDFGPAEFCIVEGPDTSDIWRPVGIFATSGSRNYSTLFGATPQAGDLLLLVAHSQLDPVEPTISGFTKITPAVTSSSLGTTLLYARLATGSEGSSFSYSNWAGSFPTLWDALVGLRIPAGEHYGTADSDTVISSDHLSFADPNPELDAGWGADVKSAFFCAATGGGSAALGAPAGYTHRYNTTFGNGSTRRIALAEKPVDGSTEDPGEWENNADKIVFAVRGTHGPCVYGGNTLSQTPFDFSWSYGPVNVSLGALDVFATPHDFSWGFGPVSVGVDQAVNLSPHDMTWDFGGVQVNQTPYVSTYNTKINVEGADPTVTLPSASVGDIYIVITTFNGATTPSISGWTLADSELPAGSAPGMAVLYRVVTGSEGSSATITYAAGATSLMHTYLVKTCGGTVNANVVTASSNPPSVTYSSTLGLAIGACAFSSSGFNFSGVAPSGYTTIANTTNEAGTPLDMISFRKALSSSPADPGIVSSPLSSANHVVATVTIDGIP